MNSLKSYVKAYTQSTLSQYKQAGGVFARGEDGIIKAQNMELWTNLWDANEKRAMDAFNKKKVGS